MRCCLLYEVGGWVNEKEVGGGETKKGGGGGGYLGGQFGAGQRIELIFEWAVALGRRLLFFSSCPCCGMESGGGRGGRVGGEESVDHSVELVLVKVGDVAHWPEGLVGWVGGWVDGRVGGRVGRWV